MSLIGVPLVHPHGAVISPWTPEGMARNCFQLSDGSPRLGYFQAITVYPGTVFLYLFQINSPVVATKIFFPVGNSSDGNVDVGIYDMNGIRLVSSGSTAMAVANTLQTIDITDTKLQPGRYFAAFQGDSVGGSVYGGSMNNSLNSYGILASGQRTATNASLPLPASIVFDAMTTANRLDIIYGIAILLKRTT